MHTTTTTMTAAAPSSAPDTAAARRRSLLVGTAATAIAIGGAAWAVLKAAHPEASQLNSLPYVAGAALIVGAVLFAWLVPARIAASGSGLPFAIVSVPLMAAFWSALPLLVGVAAILVGTAHRAAGGTKRGRALAAIIIACVTGGLTIVAILVG